MYTGNDAADDVYMVGKAFSGARRGRRRGVRDQHQRSPLCPAGLPAGCGDRRSVLADAAGRGTRDRVATSRRRHERCPRHVEWRRHVVCIRLQRLHRAASTRPAKPRTLDDPVGRLGRPASLGQDSGSERRSNRELHAPGRSWVICSLLRVGRLRTAATRHGRCPTATARVLLVLTLLGSLMVGCGSSHEQAKPSSPAGHQGRPREQNATPRRGVPSVFCVNSRTHKRTPCSPTTANSSAGYRYGAFAPISSNSRSPIQLVAQLFLAPPSGARRPTAIGRVVEQRGRFGITILGFGLHPNTSSNAYAVWLTNGQQGDMLLGLVNPAVTTNGQLKTAELLPKDPFRYHQVLITLERSTTPRIPGPVVITGSFHG